MQTPHRTQDHPSELLYMVIALGVTVLIVSLCMVSALWTRPEGLRPDTAIWILPPRPPDSNDTKMTGSNSLVDHDIIADADESAEEIDRHMWTPTAG
ncbi:hypothetical protein MTO96_050274 [Rhipicephalus appendiculatus]